MCLWFAPTAQAETEGYTNVLQGKRPIREQGILRVAALTDGRAAQDGGPWKTRLTALFLDAQAFAVYDLGATLSVHAAWLQGDNNDTYRLELSQDGRSFQPLWVAPATPEPGMQPRAIRSLSALGRYLRVRPLRGDGSFALSELQVFTGSGGELPVPRAYYAVGFSERLRDKTLLFGLALLAALLLPARPRRGFVLLALAAVAAGSWQFLGGVLDAWPVEPREIALLRGTIAFVGALAVAREAFAPARWPVWRPAVLGVLGVCAALALLAFYNLGHPQFYNSHSGRWTFAHYLDLRQYYPTAKYFDELSYSRIYDADLAALQEDRGPLSEQALRDLLVRDLDSFEVSSAAERSASIGAITQRFSPERWREYKRDAAWFRAAMGDPSYLDTLIDYGGNATPVWMAVVHVLFSWVEPGDLAFTRTGWIDLGLLLAMFVAIQRTFGWRTMLVSMLIFGANDFVMYGTNWSGATLRHDWLAYLGLGACALKRERWRLGGALLAMAALIRAFPALALVGVGFPALLRLGEQALRTRSWPNLRVWLEQERAVVQVALGALLALIGGVVFSIVVLGPGAWIEWFDKVAGLESDPHPACVALRNLIAGSDDQARLLRARWPLYATSIAGFVGAVAWVSRQLRAEQAAVLALLLVPVVFYPANYYLHLVFLLALLALEGRGRLEIALARRDGAIWITLLLMCAAQYFTTLEHDLALHFYFSTVTLFAALCVLLIVLLAHDPPLRRWLAREP